MPNVGKSTLFNALLKKQVALAANYPFATVEPNIGVVAVPDERLTKLAEIEKSARIVPAAIQFVDIAGLVKGASEGEGLGNKFLSHIREVDAIAQVVRGFADPDVIRTGENPQSDIETINTELILADLETVGKLVDNARRENKGLKSSHDSGLKLDALEAIQEALAAGEFASTVNLSAEERGLVGPLPLMTLKPMIYVLNVAERDIVDSLNRNQDNQFLVISAKVESELAELEEGEQKEYLENLGLPESGLNRFIKRAYQILNLVSFLTAGEIEAKAWTVTKGTKAPQAAATIHTDFEKGFIRAEVVDYDKFVAAGGWKGAKDTGWTRLEGKDYEVKDGDVVFFRINT